MTIKTDRWAPLATLAFLAAVACSSTDDEISDEELPELGQTIVVDLSHLFETLEQTADAVNALDADQTKSDQTCWESSIEGCEPCSSYEGTSGSGTFGASMTVTPCGETWESGDVKRTYTVENSALTGAWTQAAGTTYDWTLAGAQGVEYVVDDARPVNGVYDASWELNRLVAQTWTGRWVTTRSTIAT